MPIHVQLETGIVVSFWRDGAELERETAATGKDARDAALVIIGRFDALQAGDRLLVGEVRG